MQEEQLIPVGARVLIRDAEWRVTATDPVKEGGYRLECVGLSEIVRGKQSVFLTIFEDKITILRPEETALIQDVSQRFEKSKLYLEALIRTAPLTDDSKICVAHHAAMDPLPYQFDPALKALSQPRARILIADAVGIGKTLEAGILVSELAARGRAKRILVLATKAVLPQFQREFWNRFSIALTRLDSAGIQRVRNRIPANHNPFHYFNRAIISIDTLKQDLEYRAYLENARWDVIVIDEAHNVADRGSHSQRAKLAKLLADRSDTMIMLSATPHDGRPESFASLLNILDPTAIANPHEYGPADFADKGLVIRRFKHHIREQMNVAFLEREISSLAVDASEPENKVYEYLSGLTFQTLDQKKATGARLFSTTLTKAMFSSPAACISVIKNRLAKLSKSNKSEAQEDIRKLEHLLKLVEAIKPENFSKLGKLVDLLDDGLGSIGWNRKAPDDRLVIFTESVETLKFLEKTLPKLLKLDSNSYRMLSGAMKDTEIAKIVNEFNNGQSSVRLLLCSDVASEGINLHYFAHRMIHFDIPWSLMVFQQRNGRIDRYGQTKKPQIFYLQTMAKDSQARGDARVLKRLQEKDRNAQENLNDPSEFFLTQEEQEDRTAAEMEGHLETWEKEPDPLAGFFSDSFATSKEEARSEISSLSPVLQDLRNVTTERGKIFSTDMEFGTHALAWLSSEEHWDKNDYQQISKSRFLLTPPKDLQQRLRYLPSEVLPEDGRFDFTNDTAEIQREMQYMLVSGAEWPAKQLFWSLHPVMKWLEDRMQNIFGRHSAPVIPLQTLQNEYWLLLQGGFPNKRGYIPVHRWVAIRVKGGKYSVESLDELVDALALKSRLTNSSKKVDVTKFDSIVRKAVSRASTELAGAKEEFEEKTLTKLKEQLDALNRLRLKHIEQMEIDFGDCINTVQKGKKEKRLERIDKQFESAKTYIEETARLEDEPYLQLVALFCPVAR